MPCRRKWQPASVSCLKKMPWTEEPARLQAKESYGLTQLSNYRLSLVAQTVKDLLAMQETWVWSLGWKDPLEKGMVTYSSILAWGIPWTEEPGRLQSMGSQSQTRLSNKHFHYHFHIYTMEYYSSHKKEQNIVICSNMGGSRDCHTEWSNSDKERKMSHNIAYV